MVQPQWCFSYYRDVLESLPSELTPTDVTNPQLLLVDDGRVRIFFAPLDSVKTSASIVLVGITPGRSQALLAWRAVRGALETSADEERALLLAKRTAAFAGSMRTNLVTMLDDLRVSDALGIMTTASLFEEDATLLHSTSAVLYPTFVGEENYGGSAPNILRTPILRGFVDEVLATSLDLVPGALVLPLGSAVTDALTHLARVGTLDENRCLFGLPHPSAANGHRARQFAERRTGLATTVRRWADEMGRS